MRRSLKDGVPPLDVTLSLLAVAITMGKDVLGEAPTKFTQIAMDVVRKLEGARVETLYSYGRQRRGGDGRGTIFGQRNVARLTIPKSDLKKGLWV